MVRADGATTRRDITCLFFYAKLNYVITSNQWKGPFKELPTIRGYFRESGVPAYKFLLLGKDPSSCSGQ